MAWEKGSLERGVFSFTYFDYFNNENYCRVEEPMTKKRRHKKKRFWWLLLLPLIFLLSRLEGAKMRYKKDELASSIAQVQGTLPFFKTKTLNGKSINSLQLLSPAQKPLLVFVHGSPGSLSAYEAYLKDVELFQYADMISIDRPGFGYSDFGKTEASLMEQATLIAELLKDFPGREKILIGHSMGGPVISKLAIEFPVLVNGLVYVAPSICPELEPPNLWRKVVNFPLFRIFTPPALRVCNQEIIPLKKELELMTDGWKNVEVPATFIQGTEDNLVPPGNVDFGERMLINSASVKVKKIENGNHFILWSEIPFIKNEILLLLQKLRV